LRGIFVKSVLACKAGRLAAADALHNVSVFVAYSGMGGGNGA
jgi:hypothetical protein